MVRTEFGVVKFWYKILEKPWKNAVLFLNTMEKCGTIFQTVGIPGIEPVTYHLEMQYFYNSGICFLRYSLVTQGLKIKTGCPNQFFSFGRHLCSH